MEIQESFSIQTVFFFVPLQLLTSVSAQGVQALSPLTVCGVDVAVPSPSADQDGAPALRSLHEGQVPDGAVMHAELQVWA